ncbi:MAG: DUF3486 family protein [Deltaproteobacteria bacterium]|nr:DUF3486 family protein [Deltaproteobacteria bacterium]
MSRHSSIELLSPEVRSELDKKLAAGQLTLDQLIANLEDQGVAVSRSALGRYRKNFEDTAAKLRESREVATAFAKELGSVPNDEMGQLLIELVHTMAFRMLSSSEADKFNTSDLMKMAITLKSVSSARVDTTKLAIQIRESERKKMASEMDKKLNDAKDIGAITAEAAREARRILGFGDE